MGGSGKLGATAILFVGSIVEFCQSVQGGVFKPAFMEKTPPATTGVYVENNINLVVWSGRYLDRSINGVFSWIEGFLHQGGTDVVSGMTGSFGCCNLVTSLSPGAFPLA